MSFLDEPKTIETPYSKVFALRTTAWFGIYGVTIIDKDRFDAWCTNRIGALLMSLHKWTFIVMCYEGLKEQYGPVFIMDGSLHTCALCAKYIEDDCVNCPIAIESLGDHCERTPFADYANLVSIVEGVPSDEVDFQLLSERGQFIAMKELGYINDLSIIQQEPKADLAGHILQYER